MDDNYHFHKITEADSTFIQDLAKESGGNQNLNSKNITHWYFNNPLNSKSLWKVVYKNRLEGYGLFTHHI